MNLLRKYLAILVLFGLNMQIISPGFAVANATDSLTPGVVSEDGHEEGLLQPSVTTNSSLSDEETLSVPVEAISTDTPTPSEENRNEGGGTENLSENTDESSSTDNSVINTIDTEGTLITNEENNEENNEANNESSHLGDSHPTDTADYTAGETESSAQPIEANPTPADTEGNLNGVSGDTENPATETQPTEITPATLTPGFAFRSMGDTQPATAEAPNNTVITTRIITDNNITTHPVGTTVIPYAEFKISGTNVDIKNAKTKITFPKKNVLSRPNVTKAESSGTITYSEDDENWYIEHPYESFFGGQVVAVAIEYRMKKSTPNGFITPIKFEVISNTNEILSSTTTNFISKSVDLKPITTISYNSSSNARTFIMTGNNKNGTTPDGKSLRIATIDILKDSGKDTNNTEIGSEAPHATFYMGLIPQEGGYIPENMKVVADIPEGGVPNITDTKGWMYNENSRQATYIGPPYNRGRASLRISFPNTPYGTIHEVKSIVILDPDTDIERILPETSERIKWEVNIVEPSGESKFSKSINYSNSDSIGLLYDPKKSYDLFDVPFIVTASNTNNNNGAITSTTTTIYEIMDYDMDPRLYYKNIRISAWNSGIQEAIKKNGYKIIGIDNQNKETIIVENLEPNYHNIFTINDTENIYKKLIIRFNQPITFSNDGLSIYITAGITKETGEQWKTDSNIPINAIPISKSEPYRLYNHAKMIYKRSETERGEIIDDASTFPRIQKINLFGYSNIERNTIVFGEDNGNTIKQNVNRQSALSIPREEETTLKNLKYITLLPSGVHYIPGSETEGTKIEVISNFRNTGKTAIVQDLGDTTITEGSPTAILSFKVNFTSAAAQGNNTFTTYKIWDNNNLYNPISPYDSSDHEYVDILDLDDDGDVSEKFLTKNLYVNFIPPREVILKTSAGTSANEESSISSALDYNSEGYYIISTFNNSTSDISTVSVIDVLPYIGDHTITPNKEGSYLPRNSAFPVNITKSLESVPENAKAMKKFDFFYSTENQPQGDGAINNINFVAADAITDFSTIKMLKITLKAGQKLNSKELVKFYLPIKTPDKNFIDANNIKNNSFAHNSAAISLNNVDYTEGNKASIPLIKEYYIQGKIFTDVDNDGNNTTEDVVLGGYTLELFNNDGSPVLNEDTKQPLTTISNNDGSYKFTIYKRGDYFVKINKKHPSDEITKLFEEDGTRKIGTTGNDFILETDTLKTGTFHVSPFRIATTRNAGFMLQTGIIDIIKVDNENNPISNVTFRIEKDGQKVGESKTTGTDGKVRFLNLDQGNYSIIEEYTPENYVKLITPITTSITQQYLVSKNKIINERKRKNLKILAVDNTNHIIPDAQFEIRKKDGTLVAVVSNKTKQGETIFTNLEYGDYIIHETSTPYGYYPLKHSITLNKESFVKNKETIDIIVRYDKKPGNGGPSFAGGTNGHGYNPIQDNPLIVSLEKLIPRDSEGYNSAGINPGKNIPTDLEKPELIIDNKTTNDKPVFEILDISPRENNNITLTPPEENTEIKSFPKRLPRTGAISQSDIIDKVGIISKKLQKTIETNLPNQETFRLAGSQESNISYWLDVVPEQDKNKDKYIVLPSQGLVMPVNSVNKKSKAYNNFINGKREDFASYLETGSVELPGTSRNGYGQPGNKIIAGHSSYFKKSKGRYKTHFQKIIGMEKDEEIWVYEKDKSGKFIRYVYKVNESYNTDESDVSILKPTEKSQLTLFTCTPIGGVAGRWIVKSTFIGH